MHTKINVPQSQQLKANTIIIKTQPVIAQANHNINNSSQMPAIINTSPRGQAIPCGLFDSGLINSPNEPLILINPDTELLENMDFLFDDKLFIKNASEDNEIVLTDLTTVGDLSEMPVNINELLNQQPSTTTITTMPETVDANNNSQTIRRQSSSTSKFTDKLNQQNLKIQVTREPSFNLSIEDECRITPNTEKLCMSFLQSLPTPALPFNLPSDNTGLLLTPILRETETNPFFNTVLNPVETVKCDENSVQESITSDKASTAGSVSLDHDYVMSPRKRKISIESEYTMDSESVFSSGLPTPNAAKNTNAAEGGKRKKQRSRGIYRAKDVATDADMENYLERRRKNNISSKQSRLSKKKFYNEMDEKSRQLELDNERLKNTITHLESLTKLMKDVLLKRFTSK